MAKTKPETKLKTTHLRHARRDQFLEAVRRGPALMGILNVTPDSFSDGGRFNTTESAERQALRMAEAGADILDIGAESTRPGHTPLSADEEWARLDPILPRLVASVEAPLSIDTYKAQTAQRALALGVCAINDVWGLQRDADMAHVAAEAGAAVVVMHNRDNVDAHIDIVSDMRRFFDHSLALARAAGLDERHLLLDPGIGFGKTKDQNLAALRATSTLCAYGLPVLIGVSRKSLFGHVLGAEVDDRLTGTLAANLAALARGARVFRVHDVAEHRAALTVWGAIEGA